MRARSFHYLCRHKTIYLGEGELIVGERGPQPKVVPTYPELTCHSLEDLRILNSRPKTSYAVPEECLTVYEEKIIPYWRGRSMRDKLFAALSTEWKEAYDAGLFTEFMEQRAPGHTVLDDKIYRKGLLDFKREIAAAIAALDFLGDPEAYARREQLRAMDISCDAVILFAQRHAELARQAAAVETDPARKAELEKIAAVCTHVPAHAPRDFHEALQAYWFCHLAVITELNGWDSFSPGHLDQHLLPFYRQGWRPARSRHEQARELLEAFFVKFNNHPAPPKVGVTAEESGTYTDFANINIGGLLADGSDGSNELSHLLLEIIDEMHLLQPSSNLQLSRKTPDALLKHALRVDQQGLRVPLDLQHRQRGRGADSPRQDAGRRPGRRVQRLRGDGGVRQRGIHPHRLFQPGEGLGTDAAQRRRSADRAASRACGPARRRASARSTSCSQPSAGSCTISSRSRCRAICSSSRCMRPSCRPPSSQ